MYQFNIVKIHLTLILVLEGVLIQALSVCYYRKAAIDLIEIITNHRSLMMTVGNLRCSVHRSLRILIG
jgi:hypothetical protein